MTAEELILMLDETSSTKWLSQISAVFAYYSYSIKQSEVLLKVNHFVTHFDNING